MLRVSFPVGSGRGSVPVYGPKRFEVVPSAVFLEWLRKFDHDRLELRRIDIQSADIFGDRVVFVKMSTDVRRRSDGSKVPGIVFLRGDAVTVLLFVVCKETGEVYVVTTQQARVPLGYADYVEIPAGMMDKNDNLVSRAIAEIEEETGLRVQKKALHQMSNFCPSAGGCDEEITCFTATVEVSTRKMKSLVKKLHGVTAENEEIAIQFRTVREFLEDMRDGFITDGKVFASVLMLLLENSQLLGEIVTHVTHLALSQGQK